MKKALAIALSLLMVFSVLPMVMVSAATETYYLTGDQIGMVWNQKISQASASGGTVGDAQTDGYIKARSGCSGTGKMLMVYLPTSIYNETGLTSITVGLRANSGSYQSKSYKPYFTKAGTSYQYGSANYTDGADIKVYGNYQTVSTTTKEFKLNFTADNGELLAKKLHILAFPVYTNSGGGTLYVDYVSYTVEYNTVAYDVTIDGEVVESLYEGKTFTVPTPAEGYHYTDGTTDYFGGEEITVAGPVTLTSEINTYDVTIDGVVAASVEHGGSYTIPAPSTGYDYTDGTNTYVGGEVITVTAPVELTSVIATTTVTYTMDEGSRIVGGSTNTAGNGSFVEIDGNWVFQLPSKGDQMTHFQLPEDWYKLPYHKAVGISFKLTKTSGAASHSNYVRFADSTSNTNYVSISDGYQGLASGYSVDVDESVYGYRYFNIALKGGSNFSSAKDYLYIDDVTVTFEYDFSYVGYDVTIDGEKKATIADGDTYTVPTPAVGSYYTDGINTYVGGEVITVTAPVELTSKLYEYDVTLDGTVVATVAYGGTYTVADIENYYITDGTTNYYGGEEITVTGPVALTSKPEISTKTYTMDEGSRISHAWTSQATADAEYVEIDGNWVLKVPSKADQYVCLTLPEDWYQKENCKAVGISFSVSRTASAAYSTQYVRFAEDDANQKYVSVSEGMTDIRSSYSFDVNEDLYGYRYITIFLKGGTNFVDGKDYLYIDDVTVTFEYDPDYVAPTYTYDITIDGEVVATVEEGDIYTLPELEAGKQYVGGYVAGQEFTVTSDLAFTTEDIPFVAPKVAITMVAGAQLRFNEVTGMRYRATVDAAAVAAYEAEGYTVTMGTLISPADIIGSFDALTFDADANNYLDVVTTGYYATSENVIAGSISNIKEANYGRNYIARSYVKLEKDGEVYVSYATENDNTRSIKFLANAVIENNDLPANTAQVALIEKWAAAADWKK